MTFQINPLDAALDALVAHLSAVFDDAGLADRVAVLRGWPDAATDTLSEAGQLARIAVVAGNMTRTGAQAGQPWSETGDGEGGVTVVWFTDRWAANVLVRIFALRRDVRDDVVNRVQEALSASVPDDSGLTLTVAAYYDDRVRFMCASDSHDDEETAAIGGRWSHTLQLRVTGSVFTARTYVQTAEIDVVMNGDESDLYVTTG